MPKDRFGYDYERTLLDPPPMKKPSKVTKDPELLKWVEEQFKEANETLNKLREGELE